MIVLHVLGPTYSSLSEIGQTAAIIQGTKHYLVKNHITDTNFFEWNSDLAKFFENERDGVLEVPNLNSTASDNVESKGVSFTKYINNTASDGSTSNNSFVLKGYVRHWLDRIYKEYNKLNIKQLTQ